MASKWTALIALAVGLTYFSACSPGDPAHSPGGSTVSGGSAGSGAGGGSATVAAGGSGAIPMFGDCTVCHAGPGAPSLANVKPGATPPTVPAMTPTASAKTKAPAAPGISKVAKGGSLGIRMVGDCTVCHSGPGAPSAANAKAGATAPAAAGPDSAAASLLAGDPYVVLAYNDTGMNVMNRSFDTLMFAPPNNTLRAQVIQRGDPPRIVTDGVSISYSIPGNTHSSDKTNFWAYAPQLLGLALPADVGITGNGLTGTMVYSGAGDWTATGIPVTPQMDDGTMNAYPLATVTVKTTGNAMVVATTQTPLAVSWEINCTSCHSLASVLSLHGGGAGGGSGMTGNCSTCHSGPGAPSAANAKPGAPPMPGGGASGGSGMTGNCSACHSGPGAPSASNARPGAPPMGSSAQGKAGRGDDDGENEGGGGGMVNGAAAGGGMGGGAAASGSAVASGPPVLTAPVFCGGCHPQAPLSAVAQGSDAIPPLSRAVHGSHAGRTADCTACHPGQTDKYLRDVHSRAGLTCADCHGDMATLADPARSPWQDEPKCTDCHGVAGHTYEQPGTLYKDSRGHHGVTCAACHGAPHAIGPSTVAADNAQALNLQGAAGVIDQCTVCHVTPPGTFNHSY